MRANLIAYAEDDLFNPRREFARHTPAAGGARFVRVERQVLVRLPVTRAVVFSIHTYMVRPEALTPEQREPARGDAARRVRGRAGVKGFVQMSATEAAWVARSCSVARNRA